MLTAGLLGAVLPAKVVVVTRQSNCHLIGIYVQRKMSASAKRAFFRWQFSQRTTWIEMLGHRNGTQLAFETGTLNASKIHV